MRLPGLFAILLGACAPLAALHFSGEVSLGKEFRKPIGPGLVFILKPDTSMPGAISGWTIQVSPTVDQGPPCQNFLAVITPPFRGGNPSYLNTSYGITAREAVANSPREFSFVLDCSHAKVEFGRLSLVLWPGGHPEGQVERARAELGNSPHGTGKLWVRDFRLSAAPKTAGGVNLGQIDWIRFEVEIQFPRGAAAR